MSNIVVLGATSAIAEHVARLYTKQEHHLLLIARNYDALTVLKNDLQIRGAGKVDILKHDFSDLERTEKLTVEINDAVENIDVLLIAYGTLPDQSECMVNTKKILAEVNLNYLGVVLLLTVLSNNMAEKKSGTIAVISSVAGDRGRKSNYVYGSAKGGLTIFLQGLRNALASKGVNVLTIKPGFVDTPMTTEFNKGILWVKPEKVARDIYKAINNRKDVIYTPWFWRWIMLIIKLIPEKIFKKMNL